MSNRFFGTKLVSTAFLALALASCQSEAPVSETSVDNMREVTLTGTISKSDLNTRTNLGLNEAQTKLVMTWKVGEAIYVSDENGKYLGHLEVTSLANEEGTLAKFVGRILTIPRDGDHNVYFYTLGNEHAYTGERGKQMTDMSYTFATQISNGVAALADHDLMITPGIIHVKGGNAKFDDLTLKRQFAYGRFTLLYDNVSLDFGSEGAVVTIDTENGDIQTAASISFPTTIQSSRDNGAISLTAPENDFYVTFVPGSQDSMIKFNVTINDEEYEGYTYRSYLIEKNDFFRKNGGGAYPINVKHVDGRDDQKEFKLIYDQNFREDNVRFSSSAGGVTDLSYSFTVLSYEALQYNEKKEGYDFKCWNTKADGSGDNYEVGSHITLTYNTQLENKGLEQILYAVWEKSTIDYKVTLKYDDDTTKEISNPSKEDEVSVSLPGDGNTNPTKDGYEFLGWKEEGTEGPVSKDSWTLTKDKHQVVLVPAWKENPGIINPGYGPGNWGR